MKVYTTIFALLDEIEIEMRRLECWSEIRPGDDAFQSEQPFFVDTMNFLQWLQFVFMARISSLVESRSILPETCCIAPMAEEYFRVLPVQAEQLIMYLQELDKLITNN